MPRLVGQQHTGQDEHSGDMRAAKRWAGRVSVGGSTPVALSKWQRDPAFNRASAVGESTAGTDLRPEAGGNRKSK